MTQFNLGDLQKLVKRLEADLRERSQEVAEVREPLEKEYEQARAGQRTVETYGSWRDAYLTQSAVAWVLSCVFVRYLEDNGRIDEVWLAGEGERMQEANERHADYFRQNPLHSDRDYFQHVFRQIAKLPGCSELLAEDRNPLWRVGISGDGARELLEFWQSRDEKLKRSFQSADTRFLGDLYQDLSQEARKRYALLQTPEFVEEFILDYTLKPAIQEFGIEGLRLIDPACGSGHFLLGAFQRLLNEWQRTTNSRDAAGKALASVRGIDVNPFAVAIARFRLAMAFGDACEVHRLRECPEFHPQVFCGDSLLLGVTLTNVRGQHTFEDYPPDGLVSGDYDDARRVLSEKYHVVVGNPPYIVDSDKAHNAAVRLRYRSCHKQFSLGVPFTERLFDLCIHGKSGEKPAGYVGIITANSFMKREFGKKLIEEVLPHLDLTHLIDSSGAYIPGHGTPTVIIFGRHRMPRSSMIRAVLGIKGESKPPEVPSKGLVWRAIVDNLDRPGTLNIHVSVIDAERASFSSHPWSVGGGGAQDLRQLVESQKYTLGDAVLEIGRTTHTGEDAAFVFDSQTRASAEVLRHCSPLVLGECVRDWNINSHLRVLLPYNAEGGRLATLPSALGRFLWPVRTNLKSRQDYGQRIEERGLLWYEHSMFFSRRYFGLGITYASIASHNHFALDCGLKVFNRTAPIIKLPEDATDGLCFALLAALNSSVGNFWVRQCCFSKGGDYVGTKGARVVKNLWEDRLDRAAGTMEKFPLPPADPRAVDLASRIARLAEEFSKQEPAAICEDVVPSLSSLEEGRRFQETAFSKLVSLQEELDWLTYELYGVLEHSPLCDFALLPDLLLGQRAFEVVMARSGDEASWFVRHNAEPIKEFPNEWSEDYRTIVQRRVELIESNDFIAMLERPEHKRRWSCPSWTVRLEEALRVWLSNRLESSAYWIDCQLQSIAKLVERLKQDSDFMRVLQVYKSDAAIEEAVNELVQQDSVPYLAVSRYSDAGLRKNREWEEVWEMQRREDSGAQVAIPVPPKYGSGDFADLNTWKLRGKLDIPRERFILYPGAESDNDRSSVVGWAGWDHLQRAMALAAYYNERKENDGWDKDRLRPLLAGLAELVPWLKQWHNEVHPEYGERLGDFYEVFVTEEARSFELTWEDLRQTPNPQAPRARKRK